MYLPETICPNLQLVKLIRELYQGKSLSQEHFLLNCSLPVTNYIITSFFYHSFIPIFFFTNGLPSVSDILRYQIRLKQSHYSIFVRT